MIQLNKVYFVGLNSSDFINRNMVICKALRQGRPKRQECFKSTKIQETNCLRLMRTRGSTKWKRIM